MELSDLKTIWLEESKKLEARVAVNEGVIRKMNLEKAVGGFDELVRFSILGRNLALVYCLISLFVASKAINDYSYSIPAFIGALAMIWSFRSHLFY